MNQNLIARAISQVMPSAIATGLFVSLATFQAPSGTFDAGGAPDGLYGDVPGLVNIPCTAPPPSEARVQATEVRALAEITAGELHHVLLNGYYPAVDLGWRDGWRVMLGDNDGTGHMVRGFAYDLMGVESDSQSQMSRVQVKLSTI